MARLRGSEIGAARDALVRLFVDDLAFGWPDATHTLHKNGNVLLALEATVELQRPIAIPRLVLAVQKLAKSEVPDAVRFAGAIAVRMREAGELVDDPTKAILRVWLIGETSENKGKAVKRALQIAWWHDAALEALATITPDHLAAVIDPPPEMVSRAAQMFASAQNWDQANAYASKVANPLADRFTPADIALVFDASHNGGDLRGSHGFREFIRLLYDKNPIANPDLEALMAEHDLDHYRRAEQIEAD